MPGSDIPQQRVERRAGRADQAFGVARRRKAVDQRDNHAVVDQLVVGRDKQLLALGRVFLALQLLDDRVIVLTAIAVWVGQVPVVGLRRDLRAGPVGEILGGIGIAVAAG